MYNIGIGLGLTQFRSSGGGVTPTPTPTPLPPVDYAVSNDAQWDAVFANSDATLSGKHVQISGSNFTQRTMTGRNFNPSLVLSSANSTSSLPSIAMSNVQGLDFQAFNFQMTGWPKTYAGCIMFNSGSFDRFKFRKGTKFRHGYGPTQLDFDTAAVLPEYARIDNVQTATTTSATYAVTWQNGAMTEGWFEFFNRGTNAVYVRVGNAGVTVTAGTGQLVPALTKVRLTKNGANNGTNINPTVDTHIAILSTAGTSEINARAEIGMSAYLAEAFKSGGGLTFGSFEWEGCVFRDLSNAIKGVGSQGLYLSVLDCDFDRIYQDNIALTPRDVTGILYSQRNLLCTGFAISGIAENLNGDARDPHSDTLLQCFGQGTGVPGLIITAGNRVRRGVNRAGNSAQGALVSDNDISPSYNRVYSISDECMSGAPIGYASGEAGFPLGDFAMYGGTFVDSANLAGGGMAIRLSTNGLYTTYVGYTIANQFIADDQPYLLDNCLAVNGAVSPAAVFPNIAAFPAATTRTQIDAAIATAAEGAGKGAAATANAIDWNTTNPAAVVLWQNVPALLAWAKVTNAPASTLTALGKRRALNRRAGQTVVPGAGVEWKKWAEDGTTVLQDWTTSSGTIEPYQMIDVRVTTSGTSLGLVSTGITINGFLQAISVETAALGPASYLITPSTATPAYFADTANVPAATTKIVFKGKIRFPSLPGAVIKIFTQESFGFDLGMTNAGQLQATLKDGTNTILVNGINIPSAVLSPNIWYDLVYEGDQAAGTIKLWIDGVLRSLNFTPGNGVFLSNREVSFLATTAGASPVPTGTFAADLSVEFNGTLRKALSNTATTANADAWKLGTGSFTQGP